MKILNIKVIEFAGLGTRSYTLGDLNVIEGANESGKSSLLAFIKFMFYGLGRRASGGELGEREKYLSWSGRRAAGSMTLLSDGRRWRIERELVTQTRGSRESIIERLKIFDDETGAEEFAGKCPGEVFLGIPESVFVSSCCIAQSNIATINSADVGTAIENLLFSASENLNADKAAEILDRARKTLLYKNGSGGLLADLRGERNNLRLKLTAAVTNARNIMAKEALAEEHRRQENEANEALRSLEALWESSEVKLTLSKFDELRELERRRDELAAKLKSLENESFPDSFVPDPDFTARLNNLSRDLSAAEASLLRAEAELARLEASPTFDSSKAEIAKFLEANASGSTESVLTSYRLLKTSHRSAKKTSGVLFTVGSVAAAAGILLTILLLILPGILLLLAGGGLLAGAFAALSATKKRARALQDFLARLSFATDPGENELARFTDSCFEAVENEKNYTSVLAARRGVVDVCRERLADLRAAARAELKKTGVDAENIPNDNLALSLSEESGLANHFHNARDSLKMQIEHISNNIDSLNRYLQKFDEQLLRRRAEGMPEFEAIDSEEYKRRRTELMLAAKSAGDKRAESERQLAVFEATSDKPGRLALLLEEKEKTIAAYELKHDALVMAGEALAEASAQLRRGVTPKLRKNAGALLGNLTGGKYTELGIEQDISLSVTADGVTRPITALSAGTRDAAYISLRIALSSLLCSGGTPPLLIDEALAQIDDTRAANLLSLLAAWCREESGQCLIFTCHSREAALLRECGVQFNHIEL